MIIGLSIVYSAIFTYLFFSKKRYLFRFIMTIEKLKNFIVEFLFK